MFARLAEALEQRPGRILVLILAYLLINIAVRLSLPTSLEMDEAQQALLTQWLAAGYDSQPPLYNWVQYGVSALAGLSLSTLAGVKAGFLLAIYGGYAMLARECLEDRALAALAPLGLLTIPHIAWESQRDLTHSVALSAVSILFLWAVMRTLKRPSLLSFTLVGVTAGLGLLAKYNFVLLPFCCLVAMASLPETRRRLADWRILVAAAFAVLVFLPHGLWLWQNSGIAAAETLGKLEDDGAPVSMLADLAGGVLSLAGATLGFTGLTLLVFALAAGKADGASALRAQSLPTRLIGRMMLVFIAILLITTLATDADSFKERWLSPVLIFLPLYLCLKAEAAGLNGRRLLARILPVALVIAVLVPSILLLRVTAAGWTGKYNKQNVPYAALSRLIAEAVPEAPGAVILSADRQLAGNLRLNFPAAAVVTPDYERFERAAFDTANRPVLVVWRGNAPIDPALRQLALRQGSEQEGVKREATPVGGIVSLGYLYGRPGDRVTFSYQLFANP
ncbi:glycosyltransferase family 39 protein [Rhizobium rhizosphaerae]|uniref:glycosyltransferase family 39 protein n=1 Tax=Xaviernesmea rhizosphaerae TaxID=1672749 RepID=UPI00094FD91B|nr:glycosyltransferase family 39 protein [Xaviernesmea rhizosphaerae]